MRRGLVWSLIFIIGLTVVSFAATVLAGHTPLLGLDLKGGVSVVLQPQGTANSAQLQEAVNIIERRVNGLGVSNSEVARQGNDVVINLPGIKNSQQALNELGQTATLYFRPVDCEIAPFAAPTPATTVPKSTTTIPKHTANTAPATTAKAIGLPPSDLSLASARFPAAGSTSSTVLTATTAPSVATTVSPTTIISNPSNPASTPLPASTPVTSAVCSASNSASLPSTTAARRHARPSR